MKLAIFVGGASRRMGGKPKGALLRADGRPILAHLIALGHQLGWDAALVGDAAPYRDLGFLAPELRDDPRGVGPVGGLAAALTWARGTSVVLVACDQPYLTAGVLERFSQVEGKEVVAARATAGYPLGSLPFAVERRGGAARAPRDRRGCSFVSGCDVGDPGHRDTPRPRRARGLAGLGLARRPAE